MRSRRSNRKLYGLDAYWMVACNPRAREAAHRTQVEGIATTELSDVTCLKCLARLHRARREAADQKPL